MIRLAKYTKPYMWWILLAVILLFAQVNCDLALPDYLSQMVNVGCTGYLGHPLGFMT
jgi:ATP-binding cassette subfamily B protein